MKVTYKEPNDYFNADMKKAAKEWDKAHKKAKTTEKPKKKSK